MQYSCDEARSLAYLSPTTDVHALAPAAAAAAAVVVVIVIVVVVSGRRCIIPVTFLS